MNIDSRHIGFDIDCVVADTMEAFIRLAGEDHAIKVNPNEITDFLVEKCLDIDQVIVDKIFSRLLNEPLDADLKPMTGSVAVLERLAENAPLTFVTARPNLDPIAEWLEYYLHDDICRDARLVTSGDHDRKTIHIKALGLKYFVDDRHETCNMLIHEKDITPIVYNQPWNMGKHQHPCVEDWQSIDRICS